MFNTLCVIKADVRRKGVSVHAKTPPCRGRPFLLLNAYSRMRAPTSRPMISTHSGCETYRALNRATESFVCLSNREICLCARGTMRLSAS